MSWQTTLRLLDEATRDVDQGDLVYVADDLYQAYDRGLKKQTKFEMKKHPKPNLLFRAVAIRPMSLKGSA